jgi:hypothetical protein
MLKIIYQIFIEDFYKLGMAGRLSYHGSIPGKNNIYLPPQRMVSALVFTQPFIRWVAESHPRG